MGDRKRDKWTGRSRGGGFGHRFFVFLIRRAGIGFAYGFLSLVVVYFIPFAPRATSAVWFYCRRVLGRSRGNSLRALFTHYYRFGQTLVDRIAIGAGMDDRYRFEFDNYADFLRILDSGTGVVMIGAHVGSWEAGARFFGDYARRMNIVLLDAESEKIKKALERNAVRSEYKVIAVGGDGLDSVLKIKNALDAGEYVCFQGDRFVGGEGTVEAGFMGRPARFPRGPFLVAARMRVPVVFHYSMRGPGRRYRFHFVEAQGKTETALLDEYLRVTERIVRAYPEQWFNFYEFWK
ncbi:MAG: acyltransferase [Alistipes sp.]|jgi:predicted LPLAT superfamily acyltransferase|nr:acyltransferase [Alistipes sp.]